MRNPNAIALMLIAVLVGPERTGGQRLPDVADLRKTRLESVELQQSIEALIRALDSRDAKLRAAAATSLGTIRNTIGNAAWPIAQLLTDDDPEVRVAAADALIHFNDPTTIRPLLRAMSDPDSRVRVRAAIGMHGIASQRLSKLPDGATREMIRVPDWYQVEVEKANEPSLRGLLALACEQQSPDIPQAIPIVMKCLGTDDHDLWDASYALLASASMSVQIGQCLAHSDVSVRRGAARMLFELEADNLEADRKPAVLESLRLGINDDDAGVRLYSLLTIVQYKKANPERFLPLATDGDVLVRCAAVEALACRRPNGTRDVLFRLLAHDESVRVRVRAAFALASIQLTATARGKQMNNPYAGKVDGKANALLQVALAHYADHYFEESDYDKRAVDAESASALPDLYRAIRDERSHPLPNINNPEWPDEFEMELIAAIGAIVPAARQAVPWMVEDLRHLDTLGRGDYRVDVEISRMQAFLYTLTRIGPVPELVSGLENDHRIVRTMAAMALSSNEGLADRTVPILIESLDQGCWGTCVYSHTQRVDVACLGEIGSKSVPALLQLLRTKKNADLAVEALTLMKSDSHRVVPLIVAVVADKEEEAHVRLPLTRVLGIVGEEHKKAFDILGRLLFDTGETEALRVAAAKYLGRNTARDAAPLLRKCVSDPSNSVRSAVKSAIERLESRNN